MTPIQLKYFDDMQPGQTLSITQTKDPDNFIKSAKEYIDQYGTLQFNTEYTIITKLNPIPKTDQIGYYFSF